MIVFDRDQYRFNYRVVGVCVRRGFVLLHQAEGDDFWALPGGRGGLGEPSTETLRREFREELDVEATVGRLLWVVENFFELGGRRYHELALYYEVALADRPDLRDPARDVRGVEGAAYLLFRWFPVASLAGVRLYPSFLRDGLRALPEAARHVVHRDG